LLVSITGDLQSVEVVVDDASAADILTCGEEPHVLELFYFVAVVQECDARGIFYCRINKSDNVVSIAVSATSACLLDKILQ
jgi:hypothetical protein